MAERRALTDLRIKKIAPPKNGQKEIWDAKLPGFGVRVSTRGTKSFILMYRMGGRARRLTLGRYPLLSLADARGEAKKALLSVKEGRDPGFEKRQDKRPLRPDHFELVVRRFIEDYAKIHNRSWKESERILTREFVSKWKGRPVSTITRPEVVAIIQGIVARGSPVQATRALAAIRKLFNWQIEIGELAVSPCDGLRAPAKERTRDRVLSDAELVKILQASDVLNYPFGTICKLLVFTGQRISEVAGMAWDDIDFDKKIWSLPAAKNKAGRAHEVPLTDMAVDIIEQLPRLDETLVFPARRHMSSKPVSGFSKAKKQLDDLSGVTNWRQHDIRRTVATGMARLGIQPHIVERVLNHSSGTFRGVAGVYNRFGYLPEMRAALEKWGSHVLALQQEE